MTVTIQNAVDPRDGGIGVSCMMFFRLMGGAFGMAVLSSVLVERLPRGVAGAAPEVAPAVVAAAFSTVFVAAAGIAGLGLVAALLLKEIPLRGRG